MPAPTQDQKIARGILKDAGAKLATFQRLKLIKDKRTGKQSEQLIGASVVALTALVEMKADRVQMIEAGAHTLMVEGYPFQAEILADSIPLSAAWRVEFSNGDRHQIAGPVKAQRAQRGGPVSYFENMMMLGGSAA